MTSALRRLSSSCCSARNRWTDSNSRSFLLIRSSFWSSRSARFSSRRSCSRSSRRAASISASIASRRRSASSLARRSASLRIVSASRRASARISSASPRAVPARARAADQAGHAASATPTMIPERIQKAVTSAPRLSTRDCRTAPRPAAGRAATVRRSARAGGPAGAEVDHAGHRRRRGVRPPSGDRPGRHALAPDARRASRRPGPRTGANPGRFP